MKKEIDFFYSIYEVVRLVPYGKVTTYGAIAAYLGSKSSSRMVGWAMNKSHHQKEYVPAHRVVNRNGILTGKHFFKTPDEMQKLLEKEGIVIKNDKIVHFEKHFWNPQKELEL